MPKMRLRTPGPNSPNLPSWILKGGLLLRGREERGREGKGRRRVVKRGRLKGRGRVILVLLFPISSPSLIITSGCI